jgi:116 kDa U5 small nuclear ribonucleoprotein component
LGTCRFGNFIGEDVESEEASEAGVDAGDYVYDDDRDRSVTGQELMELDGGFFMGTFI